MSLPRDELFELVNKLDEKDVEKVLSFVHHITNRQTKPDSKFDISRYFGIYKDMQFDIDQEARKLREEWERSF